jgi:phosphatidylglycerophosphatase A
VEALPKGYGILADDIVAGVFANLLLILGRRMM